MIWVRRFFIIPLGLVFFVLLVLTLVIFRVSETFLEPQFYKEQLAKAGIYNFVLSELPTSGIEVLRSKDPDFFSDTLEENPLAIMSLTTDEIVSPIGAALPPTWVQEQVEQVIDQAGGYFTGERDTFQITVTAAERVKATTQEVEALIRKAQLYGLLFDEIVTPEIDKALAEEGTLPFNISLSGDDLVAAVQEVAPEDWVKDQVDLALDEVTDYMVGDQETFEINVQLAKRADVALAEMKTLLMKASFFELLFDEVMEPMLEGSLSQFTELPFGVGITQEETTSALRELVSPSWLEEQALVVIDEAGPYLTGKTDSFQAVIPMADRREVALTIIEDLAQSKLNTLVEGLPECNIGQMPFQGVTPSLDELPECVPPRIQAEELIDLLDIDVTGEVREMIGSQIPDQLVYTQADLRQALGGPDGESSLEVIDNVREIFGQGWTYTDVELREDLGEDSVGHLDDVRAYLSDGWIYTDVDFRKDLADAEDRAILKDLDDLRDYLTSDDVKTVEAEDGAVLKDMDDLRDYLTSDDRKMVNTKDGADLHNLDDLRVYLARAQDGAVLDNLDHLRDYLEGDDGGAALRNLDTFRSQLSRARDLRFLVYVLWALLLAGIGVLGGRHWRSKIAWAAATLGIAAAIVFAVSGPVYNSIGQSQIDDLRVDLLQDQDIESPTQLLAIEKGLDVVQTVADDFLAGIERSSLTLLVVALVVLGISLAWPKFVKRRSPAEEEAEVEAETEAEAEAT